VVLIEYRVTIVRVKTQGIALFVVPNNVFIEALFCEFRISLGRKPNIFDRGTIALMCGSFLKVLLLENLFYSSGVAFGGG
jgi:hypothetical protein